MYIFRLFMVVAVAARLLLIDCRTLSDSKCQMKHLLFKWIPNLSAVPDPCTRSLDYNDCNEMLSWLFGSDNSVNSKFYEDFLEHFSWGPVFCKLDSDDDGWTNGEELGDSDCKWIKGMNPVLITPPKSHPAICEPLTSEKCQGVNSGINCDFHVINTTIITTTKFADSNKNTTTISKSLTSNDTTLTLKRSMNMSWKNVDCEVLFEILHKRGCSLLIISKFLVQPYFVDEVIKCWPIVGSSEQRFVCHKVVDFLLENITQISNATHAFKNIQIYDDENPLSNAEHSKRLTPCSNTLPTGHVTRHIIGQTTTVRRPSDNKTIYATHASKNRTAIKSQSRSVRVTLINQNVTSRFKSTRAHLSALQNVTKFKLIHATATTATTTSYNPEHVATKNRHQFDRVSHFEAPSSTSSITMQSIRPLGESTVSRSTAANSMHFSSMFALPFAGHTRNVTTDNDNVSTIVTSVQPLDASNLPSHVAITNISTTIAIPIMNTTNTFIRLLHATIHPTDVTSNNVTTTSIIHFSSNTSISRLDTSIRPSNESTSIRPSDSSSSILVTGNIFSSIDASVNKSNSDASRIEGITIDKPKNDTSLPTITLRPLLNTLKFDLIEEGKKELAIKQSDDGRHRGEDFWFKGDDDEDDAGIDSWIENDFGEIRELFGLDDLDLRENSENVDWLIAADQIDDAGSDNKYEFYYRTF